MRMRTVGVMLVVVALALAGLGLATAAFADPGLSNIPAHRHYVQTSNGRLVQVGPRLCDKANLQNAFNQFHNNLHIVSARSGSAQLRPRPAQPHGRGTHVWTLLMLKVRVSPTG